LGERHHIADRISEEILREVRSDAPVMVFGSVARGDASSNSDVDVLQVATRSSRVFTVGRMHVYIYAATRLLRMAEQGALFVLHLKLEGQILRDPDGSLRRCLNSYVAPANYDPYRQALKRTARLLDISREGYLVRWKEYNALAVFVLRTTLYARFAEEGEPIFSLSEIARRMPKMDLGAMLTLKTSTVPAFEAFCQTRALISADLRSNLSNPYGSIEALITNEGLENPALMAFGLRLLGKPSPTFGYDLLTLSPFG
jgi:predicted nucleotidyltransferase